MPKTSENLITQAFRTLTLSEPAKSTKWNLEVMVIHSPVSSSRLFALPSEECEPRALDGRRPPPPRLIADWKLGVGGRPNVGEDTRVDPVELVLNWCETGLARREGDLPLPGTGVVDLGGGPEPVYLR